MRIKLCFFSVTIPFTYILCIALYPHAQNFYSILSNCEKNINMFAQNHTVWFH